MQIPLKKLKQHLKENTYDCKHQHTLDGSIVAKSIFAIFNKFINKLEYMTEYESGLFVQSFDKWLDRKDVINKAENNVSVAVGDICMVDWNINYNPELSYVHPCLIVEDVNNMIFAVPVSARQDIMEIAFHPVDNIDGNKNYRKVTAYDGFLKDCVLFISEAKVISKSRIINKIGKLTCDLLDKNGLFREIRWSMIQMYFPYETEYLTNIIARQDNRISVLDKTRRFQQSRADKYRIKYEQLQREVEQLEHRKD